MNNTFEVVEFKTGAKMSHQATAGQVSSTTLFKSREDAEKWIEQQGLSGTHGILTDYLQEA